MSNARSVVLIAMAVSCNLALANERPEAHEYLEGHLAPQTERAPASPRKNGVWSKFAGWIADRLHATAEKLNQVARIDEDNESLRKRVAELELNCAETERKYAGLREAMRANKIKASAKEEGGTEASRTIASLNLAEPQLLDRPLRVIVEEASKALAQTDYETAAKAYTFLVEHKDNDSFQSAQGFFLAGFALYKVGSYKRSIEYLHQSLKRAQGEHVSYAPRALGWIALCYERMGQKAASRRAVQELIQKYPKSNEARRLNRNA